MTWHPAIENYCGPVGLVYYRSMAAWAKKRDLGSGCRTKDHRGDEERNDECASDVEPVERTMHPLSQLREHAGARAGDRPDLLEARRERADEQYQVLAQRQHAEPWGTHSTRSELRK